MKAFEVGSIYIAKDFFGKDSNYKCLKRTNKTVTLFDELYKENFTKKIKTDSNGEYVVFDKSFMGYCEMTVRA